LNSQFRIREKTNLTIEPTIKRQAKEILKPGESLSVLVEKLLVEEIDRRKKEVEKE